MSSSPCGPGAGVLDTEEKLSDSIEEERSGSKSTCISKAQARWHPRPACHSPSGSTEGVPGSSPLPRLSCGPRVSSTPCRPVVAVLGSTATRRHVPVSHGVTSGPVLLWAGGGPPHCGHHPVTASLTCHLRDRCELSACPGFAWGTALSTFLNVTAPAPASVGVQRGSLWVTQGLGQGVCGEGFGVGAAHQTGAGGAGHAVLGVASCSFCLSPLLCALWLW